MPSIASQILVARRYLERGFVDEAMRLFLRTASAVDRRDWDALVDRLLERRRIAAVLHVCQVAAIPLPRERLLALGDGCLRRRDLEGAKFLYEMAGADVARWDRLLDALTATPAHQLLAVAVAARHLAATTAAERSPVAVAG